MPDNRFLAPMFPTNFLTVYEKIEKMLLALCEIHEKSFIVPLNTC